MRKLYLVEGKAFIEIEKTLLKTGKFSSYKDALKSYVLRYYYVIGTKAALIGDLCLKGLFNIDFK